MDAARQFYDVRFWGALMAAKYGSPFIRKGGSVTLTNGTIGLRPWKGWTVAASITGALEALTRALQSERCERKAEPLGRLPGCSPGWYDGHSHEQKDRPASANWHPVSH